MSAKALSVALANTLFIREGWPWAQSLLHRQGIYENVVTPFFLLIYVSDYHVFISNDTGLLLEESQSFF